MNPPARTPGVDLLWVVPLAAVVTAGSFFTNLAERHAAPSGYQPWLAVVLGACAAVGMFAAMRWPLRGAVVTYAAITAYVVLDLEDGPIYLSLAGIGFLVAARVPVRGWLRVAAAGNVAVCASLVLRAVADYDNQRSLWQLFGVVAVSAAGAALGTLARAQALAFTERSRMAAAQEQLRMAQDLHDGVGHGLAVIAMQAGVGLHVLDRDPTAARAALEAIRDSARESLDSLRSELAQISGAQISGAQISGAQVAGEPAPRRPRQGVSDLEALVDRVRNAGLSVEVSGAAGELPDAVGAVVYGVVQEALTNVLRHASATSVRVRLERSPDRLVVTVDDNGRGDVRRPAAPEGMGLRGMRKRVIALGGELSAGPGSERGFVVRAELPL